MVQLGELMMILELHRQGLCVTAIARRTGRDPKTVRKYIERGIEAPAYGPRSVGRPSTEFSNGRHLAAWMGLVPRQHSSGNLSWTPKTRQLVKVEPCP